MLSFFPLKSHKVRHIYALKNVQEKDSIKILINDVFDQLPAKVEFDDIIRH